MTRKSLVAVWRDALRDSTLSTAAKAVGFTLNTYSNGRGYSFPSRQALALGASVSVRTAERMVARLEAAGFVQVQRSSGGRARSNRYALTLPETASQVRRLEWETATDEALNGVNESAKRRHSDARKQLKATESGAPDAAAALRSAAAGALIEDFCGRCDKRLPLVDDLYCVPCAAKIQADHLIADVRRDLDAARRELAEKGGRR